jgi:hypothetical protein
MARQSHRPASPDSTDQRPRIQGDSHMTDRIVATEFLHLQHKKDLLEAERAFLADKQAFVRDSLKIIDLRLRKLKSR